MCDRPIWHLDYATTLFISNRIIQIASEEMGRPLFEMKHTGETKSVMWKLKTSKIPKKSVSEILSSTDGKGKTAQHVYEQPP